MEALRHGQQQTWARQCSTGADQVEHGGENSPQKIFRCHKIKAETCSIRGLQSRAAWTAQQIALHGRYPISRLLSLTHCITDASCGITQDIATILSRVLHSSCHPPLSPSFQRRRPLCSAGDDGEDRGGAAAAVGAHSRGAP